jgi:hypothetical protein
MIFLRLLQEDLLTVAFLHFGCESSSFVVPSILTAELCACCRSVYKAKCRGTDTLYALKVFRHEADMGVRSLCTHSASRALMERDLLLSRSSC